MRRRPRKKPLSPRRGAARAAAAIQQRATVVREQFAARRAYCDAGFRSILASSASQCPHAKDALLTLAATFGSLSEDGDLRDAAAAAREQLQAPAPKFLGFPSKGGTA